MTDASTTKPPRWIECDVDIQIYGWTGIALKPAHDNMDQVWRYNIVEPGGRKHSEGVTGCQLLHDASKGVHPDDKRKAQLDMLEHIRNGRPMYAGA